VYSNYMVLFTLVDLQSQCMGPASELVNICLGKVLSFFLLASLPGGLLAQHWGLKGA